MCDTYCQLRGTTSKLIREIRVFKAVFILNRFENFYQCFEKNGLLWQLLGRCALVQL